MQYNLVSTLEEAGAASASVAVFVFKDEKTLPKEAGVLSAAVRVVLSSILTSADFKGELGEVVAVYPGEGGVKRAILVGLGVQKFFEAETFQRAIAVVTQCLQNKKQDSFTFIIPRAAVQKCKAYGAGLLIAKGVEIGAYHFDQYKTDPERKVPMPKNIAIALEVADKKSFKRGLDEGMVLARAINHVRDLGNLPPVEMTPTYLANEARKLGKQFSKLKVTVLGPGEMKKLGMGALLGVAAGSTQPPAFIILEWHGGAKTKKPLVFVGKGITFDSGGISIKPSDAMDEMKFDMLGGAAVLGAMRVIAELGIKNNVVGLIPATENLPSGSAYRPGDILRTMGGKTIEVINTDAEGRLILADALCYAKKYEPRAVIDLATLTGACAYFLGPWHAGLFGDEDVTKRVSVAARTVGEGVWQLPLLPEHTKLIRSEVADVKNSGARISGAATAAAFLKEFTSYPWAHLDIAGTAWTWNMKPEPWMRAGATGYGVHLLVELAREWN